MPFTPLPSTSQDLYAPRTVAGLKFYDPLILASAGNGNAVTSEWSPSYGQGANALMSTTGANREPVFNTGDLTKRGNKSAPYLSMVYGHDVLFPRDFGTGDFTLTVICRLSLAFNDQYFLQFNGVKNLCVRVNGSFISVTDNAGLNQSIQATLGDGPSPAGAIKAITLKRTGGHLYGSLDGQPSIDCGVYNDDIGQLLVQSLGVPLELMGAFIWDDAISDADITEEIIRFSTVRLDTKTALFLGNSNLNGKGVAPGSKPVDRLNAYYLTYEETGVYCKVEAVSGRPYTDSWNFDTNQPLSERGDYELLFRATHGMIAVYNLEETNQAWTFSGTTGTPNGGFPFGLSARTAAVRLCRSYFFNQRLDKQWFRLVSWATLLPRFDTANDSLSRETLRTEQRQDLLDYVDSDPRFRLADIGGPEFAIGTANPHTSNLYQQFDADGLIDEVHLTALGGVELVDNSAIPVMDAMLADMVQPPSPQAESIVLSPATVTIESGETQQFTATLDYGSGGGGSVGWAGQMEAAPVGQGDNPEYANLVWSCANQNNSLPDGTITQGGLFSAPAAVSSAQTIIVRAELEDDPDTFGTATVTVPALAQPPSGDCAPWDELTADHDETGSFGALVQVMAVQLASMHEKISLLAVNDDGHVAIDLTQPLGTVHEPGTTGRAFQLFRGQSAGKWVIDKTVTPHVLKIFDVDGDTLLKTFSLSPDADEATTRNPTTAG